jgi:hypothetical protein
MPASSPLSFYLIRISELQLDCGESFSLRIYLSHNFFDPSLQVCSADLHSSSLSTCNVLSASALHLF